MLIIQSYNDLIRVVASPVDTSLKQLLKLRAEQLVEGDHNSFGRWAHMTVVEPPDALSAIETEVGFPVLTNLIDGTRFGDPDFTPSWEWIEDHGGWFELVFILTDDGFAHVLFVEDREGVDADLLAACRQACGRPAK
jgi:hypothetical protein